MLFAIGFVFFTLPTMAQPLPDVATIQANIDQLNSESPKNETLINQYTNLLTQVQQFDPLEKQRDDYRKIITQFPTLRERLENQINGVAQLDLFKTQDLRGYNDLSQAIASLQAALSEWRTNAQANNDQAGKLSQERTSLPTQQAQLDKQIEQAQLVKADQGDQIDTWLESAKLKLLKLQKEMVSAQLQSLDERTELLKLEQQLLDQKIQTATPLLADLQKRLTQVEQQSVRALIAEALDLSQRSSVDTPKQQAQVEQLRQYATELEQVLDQIDQTREETQTTDAKRRSLIEEQQLIKQNLTWLRDSTAFGESIRAQLQRLPNTSDKSTVPDTIAKTHIRKYEINQLLAKATGDNVGVTKNKETAQIQTISQQLLTQLSQDYEKLLVALGKLQLALSQYDIQVQDARSFLKEQQLWTRSNVPLWQHLTDFSYKVWFGSDAPVKETLERLSHHKAKIALPAVIIYSLLFYWLYRKLTAHSRLLRDRFKKVFGHPIKDRFKNSIILLISTFVRAVIFPLWYVITALLLFWLLPSDNHIEYRTLIIASCVALFVVEFGHTISSDCGLLELHLNWPKHLCQYLHQKSKQTRWPLCLFLFSIFTIELIAQNSEAESSRICFLLFIIGLSYAYKALLRPERIPSTLPSTIGQGFGLVLLKGLIFGSMLAIFIMAILGLYIASWILLIYQQLTILVVLGILFVYQLAERWLKLEHRQLNYQRLLARREELIAQQNKLAEEPPEIAELREDFPDVEDQGIASEQISEQSLTLLKGLSLIGLVVAILTLWSSALEMTTWLNKVVVWQVSETISGANTLVDVTLQSLIYALITLLVTIVGVRNLPGILELLVLRRLELSPGTGYAVTTLLRYLILMTGLLSAFSILGFQWSRLQWLVAAFGVGLGFGLQEIFANFISGLILLFERPIRIGDIVTIDDLSGTVSKIETRATTIIDWDNKEIVVPNKTFITQKLINWSLSDSITRIVIPIGVAYGSDVEKTEDLLYEAAQAHPLVLNEPPASVYFLAFGASSLDFELRIHINSIDHRLSTIHLINKKIDELFKQNGIEIAFPQMDVHVRDWPNGTAPD